VPAGVELQLSKHFALFGEYRYAYYKIQVNQGIFDVLLAANRDTIARNVTTSLSIQNALFGISYRF